MLFSPLPHLNPVKQAFQARTASNLFFFIDFLRLIPHSFVRALRPFSSSIPWYLTASRSWRLAALINNEMCRCLHCTQDQNRHGKGASLADALILTSTSSCLLFWPWLLDDMIDN
jgi:hypothetical protein